MNINVKKIAYCLCVGIPLLVVTISMVHYHSLKQESLRITSYNSHQHSQLFASTISGAKSHDSTDTLYEALVNDEKAILYINKNLGRSMSFYYLAGQEASHSDMHTTNAIYEDYIDILIEYRTLLLTDNVTPADREVLKTVTEDLALIATWHGELASQKDTLEYYTYQEFYDVFSDQLTAVDIAEPVA